MIFQFALILKKVTRISPISTNFFVILYFTNFTKYKFIRVITIFYNFVKIRAIRV